MGANFEQIVGLLVLDGMSRFDAIFTAQRKFPDLHEDYLERAQTGKVVNFDKAMRVTPATFEEGVAHLEKAGLTKVQALERAACYWPELHREYLKKSQKARFSDRAD